MWSTNSSSSCLQGRPAALRVCFFVHSLQPTVICCHSHHIANSFLRHSFETCVQKSSSECMMLAGLHGITHSNPSGLGSTSRGRWRTDDIETHLVSSLTGWPNIISRADSKSLWSRRCLVACFCRLCNIGWLYLLAARPPDQAPAALDLALLLRARRFAARAKAPGSTCAVASLSASTCCSHAARTCSGG